MDATSGTLAKLLTDVEVAAMSGIARGTLAKMRMTGDGPPFVKINSSVRYPAADFEAWMSALPRRTRTA